MTDMQDVTGYNCYETTTKIVMMICMCPYTGDAFVWRGARSKRGEKEDMKRSIDSKHNKNICHDTRTEREFLHCLLFLCRRALL